MATNLDPAICSRAPVRIGNTTAPVLFCRKSWDEENHVTDMPTMVALGEDYPELRESIRKICERYPGE